MEALLLTCSRCKEAKPPEEFSANRTMPNGRNYYCRACTNAYSAAWRQANHDYDHKRKRAWRKAHPRPKAGPKPPKPERPCRHEHARAHVAISGGVVVYSAVCRRCGAAIVPTCEFSGDQERLAEYRAWALEGMGL